jgi:hypothetical protein
MITSKQTPIPIIEIAVSVVVFIHNSRQILHRGLQARPLPPLPTALDPPRFTSEDDLNGEADELIN